MKVNVLLEIKSKPECIEELKLTLVKILPDTRGYEGCIEVKVIENQDDPLNLLLIEIWESRQHYEKYLGWRVETGAIKALGALLSQPASIRYFNKTGI
jgi:quinol monooxygenase YgiN